MFRSVFIVLLSHDQCFMDTTTPLPLWSAPYRPLQEQGEVHKTKKKTQLTCFSIKKWLTNIQNDILKSIFDGIPFDLFNANVSR